MGHNQGWSGLYKMSGLAALTAAVLFRRNMGAELSLFTGVEKIPQTAVAWFTLLQESPFIGLAFLAVFDLVNYALVGLVFLALGAALWEANRSVTAVALAAGLVGIAVGFATNISLTMFSLSQQYAVATTVVQKEALLAAGRAVLATNDPLVTFPSTGAYISLLLMAVAGLLFARLMLPSHRGTAVVGMLAGGCDLAYCLTFAVAPFLQVLWLASGGLFWMIWHLLVARQLFQLVKESQ